MKKKKARELKIEMLHIQSLLMSIAINTMPKDKIAEYCPKGLSPIESEKWWTKVKNVWAIKQTDQKINDAFMSIYEAEKEVRNIEVVPD